MSESPMPDRKDNPAAAPSSLCGEAHALCESARACVREQPLAAVAAGAMVGLVLGLLSAGRPRC